ERCRNTHSEGADLDTAAAYTARLVCDFALEEVVRALRAKGVVFESYPFMQQNALGIWIAPSGAKVAWFKDPDGNLLSLTQPTRRGYTDKCSSASRMSAFGGKADMTRP